MRKRREEEDEGGKRDERGSTVSADSSLPSIIDDPGVAHVRLEKHVLKPVSPDRFREPHAPGSRIRVPTRLPLALPPPRPPLLPLLLFPLPLSRLSSFSRRRLRLEAATSARHGCGPDRIRVYLRHILGVRHVTT